MIELKTGNIVKEDQAEAVINTVNTMGIMGKGIALQFKKAFPQNYTFYLKAFEQKELVLGKMLVFETGTIFNPKYIINFPTKDHWRYKSKLEYITAGLQSLEEVVRKFRISSLAIPPLGCGLGGLRWDEVFPIMEKMFKKMPEVKWIVFEPKGTPKPESMPVATLKPKMTTGRAAVIGLINRYLGTGLDYPVSLLEIQKLVYFLTAAGEHLPQVKFEKSHYGPYADVLRHVLERIDGHYTIGYGDGKNKPTTPINLKSNAREEAEEFLETHPTTLSHLETVSDLVDGFASPSGMELLATTHWVVMEENADAENDYHQAIEKIRNWSSRKAQSMKSEHIKIAWEKLRDKGWFERSAQV